MEDVLCAEELILRIFSFLDVVSLKKARLVCKKWNRIALDYTLPLLDSLKRDNDLRLLLLYKEITPPFVPKDCLGESNSIFGLNKYSLADYLMKNNRKEVIGYRYGDISKKIFIFAEMHNLKSILKHRGKFSYYYTVIQISWLIMNHWHTYFSEHRTLSETILRN